MADPKKLTAYDTTPYPSQAHPTTHIRVLETTGALFGMSPKPISRCRVLELGCASGMNLVPQALDFPKSEFLGIDLSGRQIGEAKRLAKDLGARNVEFRHADIMEVDASWGEFDYIICHGILSWVPDEVQEKIFGVFQTNLTPQGVAIVSYNTYPAWHSVEIVRNAMAFHASQFNSPQERLEHAVAFARFMAEYGPKESPLTAIFKQESAITLSQDKGYVAHEYLETCNRPFYFTQIAGMAKEHALQYLGEPVFALMLLNNYPIPDDIGQMIRAMPLLKQEQYIDFFSYRRFRSTMLCRQDVALDRSLGSEDLMRFHFALASRDSDELKKMDPAGDDRLKMTFPVLGFTVTLEVSDPLVKAAMVYLYRERPRYVSCEELWEKAVSLGKLTPAPKRDDPKQGLRALADSLVIPFSRGILNICLTPPKLTTRIAERPKISDIAQWQIARSSAVVSPLHNTHVLDPVMTHILRRLDGYHDRKQLAKSLDLGVKLGQFSLKGPDAEAGELDRPGYYEHIVDECLDRVMQFGLLVEN